MKYNHEVDCCGVEITANAYQQVERIEILYCPLHAAAPQLLEACEKALAQIDLIMAYPEEIPSEVMTKAVVVGQELEAAIRAAKGGE